MNTKSLNRFDTRDFIKMVLNEEDRREAMIEANNIGVSYFTGQRADDYKSHIYNWLNPKKKREKRAKFWPIRNVSFTAYKGEILGIIGSNGAGKTTLCKLISGILRPDEGDLKVNGKVTALFSLGLGFNPQLTGRENAYTSAMMLGVDKRKIHQYINDIHEFSGLGEFMERPIKTYSSGMRARLGFSIASLLEPEILILDEALNPGDLEFSQKAGDKMKELVSQANMVILVTHNIDYAEQNCDRLIWLDKGTIRAIGDPSTVAKMYREEISTKAKRKNKANLNFKQTESSITDRVLVDARNLGIAFKVPNGKYHALQNVSFQIREGEVVGIIGHNGAGKSTLCKVITNILVPDTGSIHINGNTTALLGYGIGFNAQLSGRDNIYLNGMFLGIPKRKIREQIPFIVEFSELGNYIDKPIKEYSSGMKSRLGFSIAAILEPDIFIIDEALSAGDQSFNEKAAEKIQEMIMRAKAVIIVTHSLNFVEKICTRAIWLKKGVIQFDGDPAEAIRRYKQDAMASKQNRQKVISSRFNIY